MTPQHFILLNYLARACGSDVVLNDEAQEFRWLPVDEALALDLNQPTRLLIEECLHHQLISHA
jgi:8-oxo-dGTP pyrophosphatase MutT (NUDIX family)